MKKVLLIGSADSHWVREFVRNVLLYRGYNVGILSITNEKYQDWYQDNGIVVCRMRKQGGIISKIPGARTIQTLLSVRRNVSRSDADIILVIYSGWMVMLALNNVNNVGRIVYWFIGSDLLRSNSIIRGITERSLMQVKNAVVINREMRAVFEKSYGNKFKGKIHEIDFGYSRLEVLDRYQDEVLDSKQLYFQEDIENYFVVMIGYNACKVQCADKVLRALDNLDDDIKRKLYFLIPMTYGQRNMAYENRINSYLKNFGLKGKILTEWCDDETNAQLYNRTDIFINAQITDAMSGAIVEHLYSGTIVLSGEWLKYSILDENQIFYHKFKTIEDVVFLLKNVLDSIDDNKEKAKTNRKRIKELFGWEECRKRMDAIFNEY